MNYAAALRYLSSLAQFGVQPGTERLAEVLRRLDDPQERFIALHIAGTNGKGSTAAFCASLLKEAASGRAPIGLYTSPHLCRVRERIKLDGNDCEEAEFAAALYRVEAATLSAPAVALTFFEVLTAAAFLLFADKKVGVAVVETGLGGRLDATRLCRAGVTVITSIGLDHTELLGPTLGHIAREKAGIFRVGVPALVACDDDDARAVICAEAKRLGAPLWLYDHRGEPDASPLAPLPHSLRDAVSLLGAHQQRNAALAVAAVSRLPEPAWAATAQKPEVQEKGLRAARWPGRLEQLWPQRSSDATSAAELMARIGAVPATGSEVWLDAAHNPEGSQALARFLAERDEKKPLTVLFGVVAGKAATAMTEPLRQATRIILTRPPSPRGLDPAALFATLSLPTAVPVEVQEDLQKALAMALAATPPGGRLLIYGSIFLIGAARALWLGEIGDPLWLQDPAAVRR